MTETEVIAKIAAERLNELPGWAKAHILGLERRYKHLTAAHETLLSAAERVLLDVDDDGKAEAHDVAVDALRQVVKRDALRKVGIK